MTKSLGLQAAQLPKIAVDLENIAAALAEAQRAAGLVHLSAGTGPGRYRREIGEALDYGDEDEAGDLCEDAVAETSAVFLRLNADSRRLFGDVAERARQSCEQTEPTPRR